MIGLAGLVRGLRLTNAILPMKHIVLQGSLECIILLSSGPPPPVPSSLPNNQTKGETAEETKVEESKYDEEEEKMETMTPRSDRSDLSDASSIDSATYSGSYDRFLPSFVLLR